MKITETIKTWEEVQKRQIELSMQHGGAFAVKVMPFSKDVTFQRFQSPCRVPDEWMEFAGFTEDAMIGYKGKLVKFTPASVERNQNRGLTKD